MNLKWWYYECGKPSTAKLNRQIAFAVSTFVVVWQTYKGTLSAELFAMYITVFTGFELGQRWQKFKGMGGGDDNTGTDVRGKDGAPGRNGAKEG